MSVPAGAFAARHADSHGHRPQRQLNLRKHARAPGGLLSGSYANGTSSLVIVKLVASHAKLTGQTGTVLAIFAATALQAYIAAAARRDVLLLRVRAEHHHIRIPGRSSRDQVSAVVAA
jgi:hypothetical protein